MADFTLNGQIRSPKIGVSMAKLTKINPCQKYRSKSTMEALNELKFHKR